MQVEISEVAYDKEAAFNDSLDLITTIQAKIDKAAKNASLRIAQLSASLNNQMRLHRAFLREESLRKLPRNPQTGEIKQKFFRNEYGGVFFRAVPDKYEVDEVELLHTFVKNKKEPALLMYFRQKIELKADTAGMQTLYDRMTPEERQKVGFRKIEGDPFGKMTIGASAGWSAAKAAALINNAIKATEYKENAEDEEKAAEENAIRGDDESGA